MTTANKPRAHLPLPPAQQIKLELRVRNPEGLVSTLKLQRFQPAKRNGTGHYYGTLVTDRATQVQVDRVKLSGSQLAHLKLYQYVGVYLLDRHTTRLTTLCKETES